LAVGAGHLGAIRDVPRAIALDNRSELVMHASILPPLPGAYPTSATRSAKRRFGLMHEAVSFTALLPTIWITCSWVIPLCSPKGPLVS
jgi:hypothetical protein